MDRIPRFRDQRNDFIDPRFAGVKTLQSDPRGELEVENRKEQRPEKSHIIFVKRAIDEDTPIEIQSCLSVALRRRVRIRSVRVLLPDHSVLAVNVNGRAFAFSDML